MVYSRMFCFNHVSLMPGLKLFDLTIRYSFSSFNWVELSKIC